jgi:hypothetical protein
LGKKKMIEEPTKFQLALAKFLAVIVSRGESRRVVAAKLKGAVAAGILDDAAFKETTDNQRHMAKQLRIKNISSNQAVASSQIKAELIARNDQAIRKYKFTPGMLVEFVGGPTVHGHYFNVGDVFEVSSIHESGRIYFKRTTGMSAYASQLRPIKKTKKSPTIGSTGSPINPAPGEP